ncbi:MAG TPA: shikimate dehydrogenase [Ruminococcaceae bacterium]|nr:shikimate dehydrogenase [Oscillospiraceae bacterium]
MEYGCIGKKLGHSFSAVIHAKLGDYDYRLCELTETELTEFMTKKDFKGINVTIPYKEAVIPFLDHIDESAEKIGAVNTIVNRNGVLTGYNTDFYGMTELLKRGKVELADKNVFILGTGGTSKTARAVARSLGAKKISIVSRNPQDGEISYDEMYNEANEVEAIINTTPVGMFPKPDASAVDPEKFPNLGGAADAVYNPLTTEFIGRARACGANAVNGLYMLVAQAAKAAELFFNDKTMTEKTDRVFSEIYKEKLNIVLIGMPGSGKTTIGKIVANTLGREFYDTDEVFVNENGVIADYFKKNGEKAFRDKESEIIAELGAKNGLVIATGGGAVLREENVKHLKQNGLVIFLDRDVENIVPTSDRPLGSDREAIQKRYDERYPIYSSVGDITVDSNRDVNTVADDIIRKFSGYCREEQV